MWGAVNIPRIIGIITPGKEVTAQRVLVSMSCSTSVRSITCGKMIKVLRCTGTREEWMKHQGEQWLSVETEMCTVPIGFNRNAHGFFDVVSPEVQGKAWEQSMENATLSTGIGTLPSGE